MAQRYINSIIIIIIIIIYNSVAADCSGLAVKDRSDNRQVRRSAGQLQAALNTFPTHCAEANSASYPQRDGK